jgi:hypothetical protein
MPHNLTSSNTRQVQFKKVEILILSTLGNWKQKNALQAVKQIITISQIASVLMIPKRQHISSSTASNIYLSHSTCMASKIRENRQSKAYNILEAELCFPSFTWSWWSTVVDIMRNVFFHAGIKL